MPRSSMSLSAVKGLSLTFDDFTAFNKVLNSPPAIPQTSEPTSIRPSHTRTASTFSQPKPRRTHRHASSTSSMSSSRSSTSWYIPSPSYAACNRRLTERERAELGDQPEMDITDATDVYKDSMSLEPLH